MSITSKVITGAGSTTPVPCGGVCVGWRVEPAGVYPVPTFPVTVRYHLDDSGTHRDAVMTSSHGRWPGEPIVKLELLAPASTQWRVTLYETNGAWDEDKGGVGGLGGLRTYMDTNPAGGPVLVAIPGMAYAHDGGVMSSGVAPLSCTYNGVPRLAARPDSNASPLRVDADGRLLVFATTTPQVPVLLDSGTMSRSPGSGLTLELLGAARDTSAYSGGLMLRLGPVTIYGGTGALLTGAVRSVKSNLVGGVTTDYTLHEYPSVGVTTGQVSQLTVSQTAPAGTAGNCATANGYVLRAQAVLNISGGAVGYNAAWELWGLP
ncbi:hypothetical protein FJV41_40890 [Myxococcus llanfairpwllgwyngyllgogerychwyrndrobwllllantysiliogogogochensis]|uniref:Uncharacterized protein n=1 Tax=Myxococcus llanfairpwllgwyngyllgogerychwyrndrobwllllantysiliogogogochensis TaxID=2590453 RepID=A0A540WMC3_9BACT|nr:hypothetical protein [Myxococcus llanfairpwllgwyngyllgogerychwyrndrobwllllantysiliogogogochensis]TQF10169.1 hypothetical protein FJV41_40890 [Myxococcus llanfairpwllgwyngyllgogerychwyrndrobwllllantysiliogogogochensis]